MLGPSGLVTSYFPNHARPGWTPGEKLERMLDELGCVVVIEDDDHISDLVAMYLRRDGFRVLQARDGESGLGLAARETRLRGRPREGPSRSSS